jgi:hypothetical protein
MSIIDFSMNIKIVNYDQKYTFWYGRKGGISELVRLGTRVVYKWRM